ncbi:hypothetical protein [Nocardiopsis sp. YSL2]|uniref:hypothetical protein n=1 Tax=Nocardiopsis sp. YSL2 TaxID=2939492 RepID=UPI0026F45B47|nr:hypothetical protein [Nocardiopsis sp. YSL2]
MRIVIAASGGQTKWAGHLGTCSHLVPVADTGQPLLARTVSQALTLTGDVHVIIPDDSRYADAADGATAHIRGRDYPSEYAATRDLWSADDRTVLLLGDVYFTREALATIVGETRRAYRCFGRYRASKHTGTPYGEIFAASWWPAHHQQMDAHLDLVHRTRAAGTVTRPPGWMLLRAWQGTPLAKHRVSVRFFTEIDDLTDDIDFPADYDRHPAFGGTRG